MPGKVGGARPGAGRPKGSREAATKAQQATIAELARSYAPKAIEALVEVMQDKLAGSARVAAANSLLDRGYGKPVQGVSLVDPKDIPSQTIDPTRLSDAALIELLGAIDASKGE